MITVDAGRVDHVEMVVAAPFTAPDLADAGAALRRLAGTQKLRRVLVVVQSIRLPKPDAIWEDLKLTPLIGDMRWVAVVTEIEWYGRLAELAGALWPGLTIKHFEPAEVGSAREWLASRPDD
jgi:stage II sporulation SpoAA-like protein